MGTRRKQQHQRRKRRGRRKNSCAAATSARMGTLKSTLSAFITNTTERQPISHTIEQKSQSTCIFASSYREYVFGNLLLRSHLTVCGAPPRIEVVDVGGSRVVANHAGLRIRATVKASESISGKRESKDCDARGSCPSHQSKRVAICRSVSKSHESMFRIRPGILLKKQHWVASSFRHDFPFAFLRDKRIVFYRSSHVLLLFRSM